MFILFPSHPHPTPSLPLDPNKKNVLRIAINHYLVWSESLAVRGIQLTEISVPEVVDVNDRVNLTCTYHMGGHTLNSVKWYKDGMEFFR